MDLGHPAIHLRTNLHCFSGAVELSKNRCCMACCCKLRMRASPQIAPNAFIDIVSRVRLPAWALAHLMQEGVFETRGGHPFGLVFS